MTLNATEADHEGQIVHSGRRRLVRVTCDVLLPEYYTDADLASMRVRNLRVEGGYDEMLYDFIQVTVQEARVELIDHG